VIYPNLCIFPRDIFHITHITKEGRKGLSYHPLCEHQTLKTTVHTTITDAWIPLPRNVLILAVTLLATWALSLH
jgi:hypothetical protein